MTQTKFLHFDAFLMLASFPFIQVRLDIVTLSQTFLRMAFDQIQTLAVFYAGTVMTVLPIQFCCHLVIVDVGNLSGPLQLTPLHVYSQALQCISLPTFLSNPSLGRHSTIEFIQFSCLQSSFAMHKPAYLSVKSKSRQVQYGRVHTIHYYAHFIA